MSSEKFDPVQVLAQTPDGPVDITEGVQALYDLVINSMDWGSGFLTVEDALPVVHVAKTCGFKDWEEAQKYVESQEQSIQQQRFLQSRTLPLSEQTHAHHDHVRSGDIEKMKCLWPKCSYNFVA